MVYLALLPLRPFRCLSTIRQYYFSVYLRLSDYYETVIFKLSARTFPVISRQIKRLVFTSGVTTFHVHSDTFVDFMYENCTRINRMGLIEKSELSPY